ncbi:DUF3592 domain-containing protein [Nocardioides sp. NPDC058538]|uniref:DUF3592 domain-containing protein n=1 Tax=Nocardioides sp. NPDC058538 TaxID=3346542 RepID=UPI0036660F30
MSQEAPQRSPPRFRAGIRYAHCPRRTPPPRPGLGLAIKNGRLADERSPRSTRRGTDRRRDLCLGLSELPWCQETSTGSRRWSRTSARVTKAWRQDVSGAASDMTYHVNYTFTAPETGGSYYGHSEHGPQGVETGDDIEVMYDPEAPYNNELPMGRFAPSFFPLAFGFLAVFGAVLSISCLAAAIVIIADLIG